MANKQIRSISDFIPEPKIKQQNLRQNLRLEMKSQMIDYLKRIQNPIKDDNHQYLDPKKIIIQNPQMQALHTPSKNPYSHNNSTQIPANRLKLKDYLHLNSIQKRKNRSLKSKGNSTFGSTITTTHLDQSSNISQHKSRNIRKTTLFRQAKSAVVQQIHKQIKQQIIKLNQINDYMAQSFVQSQHQSQTAFFMMNVLQNLRDQQHLTYDLSKKIIDYESKTKKPQQRRQRKKLFWDQQVKLQSPAKLGLQLTVKIMQDFNILPPDL